MDVNTYTRYEIYVDGKQKIRGAGQEQYFIQEASELVTNTNTVELFKYFKGERGKKRIKRWRNGRLVYQSLQGSVAMLGQILMEMWQSQVNCSELLIHRDINAHKGSNPFVSAKAKCIAFHDRVWSEHGKVQISILEKVVPRQLQ